MESKAWDNALHGKKLKIIFESKEDLTGRKVLSSFI